MSGREQPKRSKRRKGKRPLKVSAATEYNDSCDVL